VEPAAGDNFHESPRAHRIQDLGTTVPGTGT